MADSVHDDKVEQATQVMTPAVVPLESSSSSEKSSSLDINHENVETSHVEIQIPNPPSSDSGKCQKKKATRQWTEDEDRLLKRLVEEHGDKEWSVVAESIQRRSGKQCRERWHNHLRPDIKKNDTWTDEEDMTLIQAQLELGNRWTEIARRLPGRSENSVKNRWKAANRKQICGCSSGSSLIQDYIWSLRIAEAVTMTPSAPAVPPAAIIETQDQIPMDTSDVFDAVLNAEVAEINSFPAPASSAATAVKAQELLVDTNDVSDEPNPMIIEMNNLSAPVAPAVATVEAQKMSMDTSDAPHAHNIKVAEMNSFPKIGAAVAALDEPFSHCCELGDVAGIMVHDGGFRCKCYDTADWFPEDCPLMQQGPGFDVGETSSSFSSATWEHGASKADLMALPDLRLQSPSSDAEFTHLYDVDVNNINILQYF